MSNVCVSDASVGMEESGEPRKLVEVTEGELPGHMALEKEKAMQEQRPPRQGYKDVPLTGCHQSVMPVYRLSGTFGKMLEPDERGLFRMEQTADAGQMEQTADARRMEQRLLWKGGVQPWVLDPFRRVIGLQSVDGKVAEREETLEDARAWARAFARDVRGVFCQNHDHNCVATCAKYAKPVEGEQAEKKKRKKLDPRSYCRFLFVRIVEFKVLDKMKRVLRRGKELVEKAGVCSSNTRNEYGRVQVVRRHPFRSTSNDVCQAFARCNIDVQRNDRVVPEDVDAQTVAAMKPVRFFYGEARLSADARLMLAALAEGMRSSHICDFYMTKYLAKGQQVLASAITPVLQGLERLDSEIASGSKVLPTAEDLARAKLRRILFSANRAHWFSACELAIFVLTGGHSIATHIDRPLFLSKVFYLLEEGKRLRNGALTGTFVEAAALAADVEVVQCLQGASEEARSVPSKRPVDVASTDAGRESKRQRPHSDVARGDGVSDGEKVSEGEADAEECADAPEDAEACVGAPQQEEAEECADAPDRREACVAAPHGMDVDMEQEESGVRMFRATASTFDDWLHRGFFLQDMNFHTYAAYIEITPRSKGSLGECYVFDAHYIKAKTYWQRVAHRMAVPRVVGAACPRMDVGDGEENARYKLALFGLMRCPGVGACADPVSLSAAYLSRAASPAGAKSGSFRFGPAWKLRRAEVEVLADAAERKIQVNKKLPTLKDCTAFRCLQGTKFSFCQVLVRQIFYHGHKKQVYAGTQDFCKLVDGVCSFLEKDATIAAEEQLHLSEFVAYRTRDMVLRLDMHTEARNTAIQTAKDRAEGNVEEDMESLGPDEQQIMVEIENVGGEAQEGDEDEVGERTEVQGKGTEVTSFLPLDAQAVRDHLLHASVLREAKQRGARTSDAARFMLEAEKALESKMQVCKENFPVSACAGWRPGASIETLFRTQQQYIDLYRQVDQVQGEMEELGPVVARPEREAAVRLMAADLRLRGPAAVAKMLAERAGLNRDQLGFVAIVAKRLQDAFNVLPPAANGWLSKDGVLLRCLLVGGGGCGKTRIINMVLRPLFEAVFGEGSMQAQAPSNKAARQIQGRTMHTANKLRKDSSLRTVHLRVTAETRKALECNTVPLAAIVIDEFSQCIGQMLHADALRKSYGRQNALGLEIHRYAEFDQTWGRMPVVLISGDELQLPPVPFSFSLLATTEGTSDEHKAGVHLFAAFEHVYRLRTAMRFQDPVLENILHKMRTPGGARLSAAEWKALLDTNVTGVRDAEQLQGTESYFQACYTWSVVSMAYTVRSFESAKAARQTLYAVRAVDVVQNVARERARAIAEAIVGHPNMNETGRLPHYGLYHVGMEVRFTQTVAAPNVVVDTVGIIRGFAFAAEDANRPDLRAPFVVLRRFPDAIYVQLQDVPHRFLPDEACIQHSPQVVEDCRECVRMRNTFLVKPFTNQQAWSLKVTLPSTVSSGTEEVSVKVRRTQMPLVTVKASTLHVLQGTTTDPGLIFHWRFPRRLQGDMRWLAAYVALSRVRSLSRLRSVGLDSKIRALLEQGPPDTLPARFQQLFAEKEAATHSFALACLEELGW